jgi:cytidine deaminase
LSLAGPIDEESDMDEQALIAAALAARAGAYAPYSGFRVGVALLAGDGTLFRAANLENASLGLSVCAERNAIAAAVFAGHQAWTAIAIATDAPGFTPPCGACLQVMREFTAELTILLVDREGAVARHRLRDFLPHPFVDYPRPGPGR